MLSFDDRLLQKVCDLQGVVAV